MKTAILTFLSVAVGAFVCGCSDAPVEETPVRPLIVTTVKEPPSEMLRTFTGVTQAETNSALSFLIGGRIASLSVRVGMQVEQGQVIAKIDPTDFQLQLEQAEAQVRNALAQARSASAQKQSARSQLNKTKEDFNRISVLYEKDSVGKAQYDGAIAAMEAAEASLNSSDAAIDAANAGIESARKSKQLAQQQLDYTILKAPQAGAIGQVPVEVNQVTQSGATIATLVSQESIQFEIGVPESLVSQVTPGMPGQLRLDALPNRVHDLSVTKVSVLASQTSTYQVTLRLAKNDPTVRPGMAGEVQIRFPIPIEDRVIVVPAVAVAGLQSQRFVWVYDKATSKVQKRVVIPGGLVSKGIQILEGLKPGEMIATRGVNRLSEGMKVKLLSGSN